MKYSALLLLIGTIGYVILLIVGITLFNGSTDYNLIYCDGINGNKWGCNLREHIDSVVGDYGIVHIAWFIYTVIITIYLITLYNPSNPRGKRCFDGLFWIFSGGYFWFLLSCYIVFESYDSQSYFNPGILISVILIPFFILGIKKWISKGYLPKNSLIFICIFQILCLVSLLLPQMYQFVMQEGKNRFIADVENIYFSSLLQAKDIKTIKGFLQSNSFELDKNILFKFHLYEKYFHIDIQQYLQGITSHDLDMREYLQNRTLINLIEYTDTGSFRGERFVFLTNEVLPASREEREYYIFMDAPGESFSLRKLTVEEQNQQKEMFRNEVKIWEMIKTCSKKRSVILAHGQGDYQRYGAFFIDDQKIFESYWYKNVLHNNYFKNSYISWGSQWKICGAKITKEEFLGFGIPFDAQLKKPSWGDYSLNSNSYLLEKNRVNWDDNRSSWVFPYSIAQFVYSGGDRSTNYEVKSYFE